jgi:CRP-like cAMP-binding protein
MTFTYGRASTPAEVEAVQKLRYTVYVEELGRYGEDADRASATFDEPEDAHSWLFYARDGDDMVATARMTWGGDGFSDRQLEQYGLRPFLDELPAEHLAVGERASVLPAYRGTTVLPETLALTQQFVDDHDVRVVFGCCEPHLLSLYLGMGQRTYADHNINSPSAGYLIPLLSFVPDAEALRGLGRHVPPTELPVCVQAILDRDGSVRSEVLSAPNEYWGEVHRTLDELHAQGISVFDGFSDDEAQRCLARSNIIECAAGDRILKRGGSARNIFVVLDGTLEARDDGRVVNVLTSGDAFGEMAFLLERPRSFDVDAATDARIISLSEGALRSMIAEEPTIAAKLLLNISKMLCVRLIRAS